MSDEVDDLLRSAMTTLDHQVPEGYFDTLASRTLARLDDPTIGDLPSGELPKEGAEDAEGAEAVVPASSSPGFPAVALSEPAKPPAMSGPDDPAGFDELARARAMRQAGAHASDPGAVSPAAAEAASLPDQRAHGNRRSIFTVVGLGLAAAAAAMIFVSTRAKSSSDQEMVARVRAQAEVEALSVQSSLRENAAVAANGSSAGAAPAKPAVVASNAAAAAPEPAAASAHAGSAAPGDQTAQIAIDTPPSVATPADPAAKNDEGAFRAGKTLSTKAGGKGGAFTYEPKKIKGSTTADISSGGPPGKPTSRDGKTQKGASGAPGKLGTPAGPDTSEPSKLLSRDDIQRGMAAVAAKVRACFTGTAGRATVQLTVAPSGQVQKVTVTGAFAGTAAGTCVERAVKATTFPARDGGPESFSYDFSLSE